MIYYVIISTDAEKGSDKIQNPTSTPERNTLILGRMDIACPRGKGPGIMRRNFFNIQPASNQVPICCPVYRKIGVENQIK